ncbi:ribonuclease PH [Fimbriimonadia bacterium ATM]|nr:MAG: ribonuclease PH [Armatimonadota bacterium]MBC6968991.1 ribonuclease PH [Armatimonadota bacterium]MCE7900120.1 ribonuclease PH [Armatimonadetes bacterium ATM1]MDL1929421.1 ribonuclease PH [Fimbriimonadia bacterium ATM]RIJ95153.1 MAG: ribonuclease PH [Armatimonadota bacterium]
MNFERPDGRAYDELRPVTLERGVAKFAEGSCRITMGDTIVLVTATVEDRVPMWRKGKGEGWVTAEYGMLPRSGRDRNQRDTMRPNGRSLEIQRLIGRCMRSVVDMSRLGERTITLDCDAIQADGGTRTASITAAYVALNDAFAWMMQQRMIDRDPLLEAIAAVSVGIVRNTPLLDLNYDEDSQASVDMNLVMTDKMRYVEVQGTAEGEPFEEESFARLIGLGKKGIRHLLAEQNSCLST